MTNEKESALIIYAVDYMQSLLFSKHSPGRDIQLELYTELKNKLVKANPNYINEIRELFEIPEIKKI